MAYDKNTWVDQNVERPRTYEMTNNADGSVTLIDSFGLVDELGTPVNADYMNHIEEGIAGAAVRYYNATETYQKGEPVWGTVDEESTLYLSLVDQNTGNQLTDTDKWQKAALGGSSGSGLSLFDVVEKDHVLTFEESKGLALLGTYVYKEPVQGVRYGYPDFYNKCLEEYNEADYVALENNVTVVGSPTIENSVASGFSTSNYLTIPAITQSLTSYESVVCFTTPLSFRTGTASEAIAFNSQDYYGLQIYITGTTSTVTPPQTLSVQAGGDGSSWNVELNNDTVLQTNKKYWAKLTWDGTTYSLYLSEDGIEYTLLSSAEYNTFNMGTSVQRIGNTGGWSGNNYFTGSIDLKESYININGERWWSGTTNIKKNSNGHIFYDIAQKEYIDEIWNTKKEAPFYGMDIENERIFLPRTTRSQYTMNTAEVGDYQEAGLPNITGTSISTIGGWGSAGANGAFYMGDKNSEIGSTGDKISKYRLNLDASRSSSIYGKSDTVQPFATKKLLYMVVGNTEVAEAQTGIIEVATTENDTIPLYHNFYSAEDMTTNGVYVNASLGSYLSGDVYTTVYNDFVNKIGQSFCAGAIKEYGDETVLDYDVVVNQTDMTFRLPLLNGEEDIPDYNNKTDITWNTGDSYTATRNSYLLAPTKVVTTDEETTIHINGYRLLDEHNIGAAQDRRSLGMYFLSPQDTITIIKATNIQAFIIPAKGNGNLYFKLTNAVQNQAILDVAGVTSALNEMNAASRGYLVERYKNGNSWYRVYSDGWCEQGGMLLSDNQTVVLLKPYKDTSYMIWAQWCGGKAANFYASDQHISSITVNGFVTNGIGNSNVKQRNWKTEGYIN